MPSAINNIPAHKPAPFVVGPTNTTPLRPANKIPRHVIEAAQAVPIEEFDAEKHVNFEFPKRTYTTQDWGYEDQGISPIAGSDSFPLFSEAAAKQVRRELLSDDVLKTCQYTSTFTKNQIREYTQKQAPSSHALWKSPEFQNAVSAIAGMDLVLAFEYEIGHLNLFFSDGEDDKDAKNNIGFSWHYDSFPFVCVTMLSDCSDMKGGERAILKGDGEILKVRGPTMGTAVVLQGRYIKYAALKAIGKERISFITAFRPKSSFMRDELVLTGARPISNQSKLMFRENARQLRMNQASGIKFDPEAIRGFIQEQRDMLDTTFSEMIPIYDVEVE